MNTRIAIKGSWQKLTKFSGAGGGIFGDGDLLPVPDDSREGGSSWLLLIDAIDLCDGDMAMVGAVAKVETDRIIG